MQIVTQRSEFDEDPATFRKDYEESQNALTTKIVEARKLVKQVWPRLVLPAGRNYLGTQRSLCSFSSEGRDAPLARMPWARCMSMS